MKVQVVQSVDPGSAGAGSAAAHFFRGLCRAWSFVRHPARPRGWSHADVVVAERPEHQGDRSMGARPIDLINLSWEGALVAASLCGPKARLCELHPSQWKGMLPKPVHHGRLWQQMSVVERALFGGSATADAIERAIDKGALDNWKHPGVSYYPRSFKLHNALDAWGLGRYYIDNPEECESHFR